MAIARMSAVEAARRGMTELGLAPDPRTEGHLRAVEETAREDMDHLDVREDDEFRIVVGLGLHVERRTYQELSDEGLLPPAVTRTLLHEVDDEVDDLSLHGGGHELGSSRRQRSGGLETLTRRLAGWLPEPAGSDPDELAYAEATARRLATRRTAEALDVFDDLSAIRPETVERARATFHSWEQAAIEELDELDSRSASDDRALHARQVATLTEAAAKRELKRLVDSGLLPDQALRSRDLPAHAARPSG